MKCTQKTKYFVFGTLATAVLAPLAIYAVETIPVTFSEGDVISASVMNTVLKRVNDTQRGFLTKAELNGTWACTTYSPIQNSDARCVADGSLLYKKTGTLTLDATAGTWSYAGTGGSDSIQSCGSFNSSGDYDVRSSKFVLGNGNGSSPIVFNLNKKSPTQFAAETGINFSFIECSKNSTAPAPADALTATVSGTSVALAWTDQSTDETGFKVQYKTSAKGSWTTATTTAANATTFTLSSLTAGKYWIRVIAKNSDGDAMSSSEVQAEVQ